jgi:hypothetical protein
LPDHSEIGVFLAMEMKLAVQESQGGGWKGGLSGRLIVVQEEEAFFHY